MFFAYLHRNWRTCLCLDGPQITNKPYLEAAHRVTSSCSRWRRRLFQRDRLKFHSRFGVAYLGASVHDAGGLLDVNGCIAIFTLFSDLSAEHTSECRISRAITWRRRFCLKLLHEQAEESGQAHTAVHGGHLPRGAVGCRASPGDGIDDRDLRLSMRTRAPPEDCGVYVCEAAHEHICIQRPKEK